MDRQGRPLKHMSLQQRVEIRRLYAAKMPRWRHPLVGYLLAILIVGLGLLAVIVEQNLMPHFYFADAPMLLSVLLVSLFWGVGPSLFSVLLATLALDYFYVPPFGQFSTFSWNSLFQLLPFIIASLVVAIITAQRESARYRALYAEQLAQEHADELAIANQELEQANSLKDQFLSMASHELKTPITTIRGQAQVVLRRLSKQQQLSSEMEPVRIALEKIDGQTHRLNTLVEDLLDLSTIRAGSIKLQLGQCDLVAVCHDVVEDQHLLTGRQIELEASSQLMAQADCDRISQVMSNLVSNAIKYSVEGSPVKVSVRQQDKEAIIEVHDIGKVISPDQQTRIFDLFYRAPGAEGSSKGGWGLGLAICKDIVERHAGRIWCESSEDKGTSFFVELPLR